VDKYHRVINITVRVEEMYYQVINITVCVEDMHHRVINKFHVEEMYHQVSNIIIVSTVEVAKRNGGVALNI
jgi:hypothetical protein